MDAIEFSCQFLACDMMKIFWVERLVYLIIDIKCIDCSSKNFTVFTKMSWTSKNYQIYRTKISVKIDHFVESSLKVYTGLYQLFFLSKLREVFFCRGRFSYAFHPYQKNKNLTQNRKPVPSIVHRKHNSRFIHEYTPNVNTWHLVDYIYLLCVGRRANSELDKREKGRGESKERKKLKKKNC